MFWWEVQIDDRDDIGDACVYVCSTQRIEKEEADVGENGDPCESVHFVESSAFVVVQTIDDNYRSAVIRAIGLLSPDIRDKEENVQWER